jgi:hypothetical protein
MIVRNRCIIVSAGPSARGFRPPANIPIIAVNGVAQWLSRYDYHITVGDLYHPAYYGIEMASNFGFKKALLVGCDWYGEQRQAPKPDQGAWSVGMLAAHNYPDIQIAGLGQCPGIDTVSLEQWLSD